MLNKKSKKKESAITDSFFMLLRLSVNVCITQNGQKSPLK